MLEQKVLYDGMDLIVANGKYKGQCVQLLNISPDCMALVKLESDEILELDIVDLKWVD